MHHSFEHVFGLGAIFGPYPLLAFTTVRVKSIVRVPAEPCSPPRAGLALSYPFFFPLFFLVTGTSGLQHVHFAVGASHECSGSGHAQHSGPNMTGWCLFCPNNAKLQQQRLLRA